jgi:VanZ family protein
VAKNYWIHSVSVGYTIALSILSLVRLTDVPKLNTGYDDKIAHFVLYAGLCLFWFMSFHALKSKSSLVLASLLSIVFGLVIEILQGIVSIHRTTEIYDLVANCLGVLTMAFIINAKKEVIVKKL